MDKWAPYVLIFMCFIGVAVATSSIVWEVNPLAYPYHSWTQSDRLALAECYEDNGYQLFTPRTYTLITREGVTAGDLPLVEYFVALMHGLFGLGHIFWFRAINQILLFVSSVCLLRFFLKNDNSSTFSVVVTAGLLFLPLRIIYSYSLIPVSFGISIFIIGISILGSRISSGSQQQILTGVLILGIGVLIRRTLLIPYLALMLGYFWQHRLEIRKALPDLLCFVIGLLPFVAWSIRSKILESDYGSIFLSEFQMIGSLGSFVHIVKEAIVNWIPEYPGPIQILFLLGGTVYLIFSRANLSKTASGVRFWEIVCVLNLMGAGVFVFLMGHQFVDHDYYFLDIFFFPGLFFCFVFIHYPIAYSGSSPKLIIGIFVCFLLGFQCVYYIQKRHTLSYTSPYEISWNTYSKGGKDMDKFGITPSDSVYVLGAWSTNGPLSQLKRNGKTLMTLNGSTLNEALLEEYDFYIVRYDVLFNEIEKSGPTLIEGVKLGYQNDRFFVLLKSPGASFSADSLEVIRGTDLMPEYGMIRDSLVGDNYENQGSIYGIRCLVENQPEDSIGYFGEITLSSEEQGKLSIVLEGVNESGETRLSKLELEMEGDSIWRTKRFYFPIFKESNFGFAYRKIYFWNLQELKFRHKGLVISHVNWIK